MRLRTSLLVLGCGVLLGCNSSSSSSNKTPTPSTKYHVDITYTTHGVPHINARDYPSLGYGVGYVQAEENLCTLSEQIMKLNGEKARYLGAGETGPNSHVLSDMGYRLLDYPSQADSLYSELPETSQQLLQGFVDGFNRSLAERNTPADYPSPCRGADWVKPITTTELLAYHLDLAGLASARNFIPAMATATPPTAAMASLSSVQLDGKKVFTSEGIGSNGWGIGRERAEDADSLLLANPHFPWDGELRFFEQHLTIPGEIDVTGVAMIGMPAVLIGFNEHLGWTHTVSQSKRFTLYTLQLDPNDPTRYRYGDDEHGLPLYRDMTTHTVVVPVKQPDGSLLNVSKTLYKSHYGPVLNLASLGLPWTTTQAVTFRDANAGNTRMLQHWLAMGKATNTEEFFQAFHDHQGIPWVNTVMISAEGTTSYLDGSQVPQLSPQAEGYWSMALNSPQLAPVWQDGAGSVVLDGSNPDHEWVDTGDAGAPGLVPFHKAPQQTREDYVFNANSSHWLTNLDEPLTGYSLMYGPENTIRSTRTRYNAQLISDDSGNGLAGADNNFNLTELKSVLTHNGSLFGSDFKNALVQRCTDHNAITIEGDVTDLSAACLALSGWDGAYNLDSTGAHLMREFLYEFRVGSHRELHSDLFETPFDANHPATTPSGLKAIDVTDVDNDPVLLALAKAAARLTDLGLALDARLEDVQYVIKAEGQDPIAITGANSFEGVFNMAQSGASRSTAMFANVPIGDALPNTLLRALDENDDGTATPAYRINYGTSIVFALQYHNQQPTAKMFLTYSQSHDPESEFFSDQTELYSQSQWRDVVFDVADIEANRIKPVLTLRE